MLNEYVRVRGRATSIFDHRVLHIYILTYLWEVGGLDVALLRCLCSPTRPTEALDQRDEVGLVLQLALEGDQRPRCVEIVLSQPADRHVLGPPV